MTTKEKIALLQDKHFAEWYKTRSQVEKQLSDEQTLYCCCGKLATGMHERFCNKFRNKVNKETVKRLEHLI